MADSISWKTIIIPSSLVEYSLIVQLIKTYIVWRQTEQDIAEIAGAGLNWIRVPIPFWAIETWPGEPFLAKISWKYVHMSC